MSKMKKQATNWSYDAAQRAVPYVRRLLVSLREHYVSSWHFHTLAGRDRENPFHRESMLRHRQEGCDILEDLGRLGVLPYANPLRGIALFPFTVTVLDAGRVVEREAFWTFRDSRDRIDGFIFHDDLATYCDLEGHERPIPDGWMRPGAVPTLNNEARP